MSIKALGEQRKAVLDERKALHEKAKAEVRDFTDDEQGIYDQLTAKAKTLKDLIDREANQDAEEFDSERGTGRRSAPDVPGDALIESGEPEWFKDKNKGFRRLGTFLEDLRRAETPGSQEPSPEYRRWSKAVLSPEFQQRHFAAGTGGMISAVASEGGALIPGGFVGTLLEKPMKENPLLSGLQQIPITQGNTIELPYINETSRATGSRQGGIRVYRDAELESLTQSKTAVAKLKLTASAMTGMAYVSNDLLKFSAISVEALVTRLFQREFTFKIQDEVINGNGGQELVGILNAPCKNSVAKEAGQAADTVVLENVLKLWSRRHVASGPYVWVTNQDTFPQLATMTLPVGTGGTPAGILQQGVAGSPGMTMMGAPLTEAEQAATVGDEGDLMLVAPGEYIFAPVPGVDSDYSIHLKFDYRQTAFRFVMFNAGAPWWSNVLTPYKGSTNYQSPFNVLASRA